MTSNLSRHRLGFAALLAAFAALALPAPARAEVAPSAQELPAVVVSGTNFEIQRTVAPQVFARSARIQQTAPGQRSPYLGAFTGNQVNQTVDGMRFSNSLFRTGPNQYFSWVPDAFVSEVSVSDGGNVGGSIDRLLGISPSHLEATVDSSLGFIGTASFRDKRIGITLSTIEQGNVETAKGTVPHSSYNQRAIIIQSPWATGQKTTILRSHSRDLERPDKWNGGLRSSGVQAPSPYTWERQDYTLLKHEARFGRLGLAGGFQRFEEFIRDGTKPIHSDLHLFILNADYTINAGSSAYLSANREEITYDNGVAPGLSNPRQMDDDVWYTFRQGVRWLGQTGALRWVASGGLKQVEAGSLTVFRNPEAAVSVSYHGVFAGYDRSTNAPSYFSLKQALTSGRGLSLPNPNLKAEYADTFRAGYKAGPLHVDVYEKRFRNAIQSETVTNNPLVYRPYNGGSMEVRGASFSFSTSSLLGSKLGLDARAEYNFGRNRLPDGKVQPTDKTTPFVGYLRLSWAGLWSEFLFQPKATRLSPSDLNDVRVFGHNSGYRIVNIGYTLRPLRGWTTALALNNLFNDDGRVLGSSVDIPKRGLSISVRRDF